MATGRQDDHGEEEHKPRFGPGSGHPDNLDGYRNDELDNKPASGPLPEDFPSLDNVRKQESDGDGPGGGGSKTDSPSDIDDQEQAAGKDSGDSDNEDGGLYKNEGGPGRLARLRQRLKPNDNTNKPSTFKKYRNMLTIGGLASVTVGSVALFIFTGAFSFNTLMKDIEAKGFLRYQVDIEGRSPSWVAAYMELRMGEVDDPNIAPKDRDNLLFRANNVNTNRPWTDWYRTMRASPFEQDLLDKEGIKFTSVAKRVGNQIIQRPGIITFVNTDERLTFDPSPKVFAAIESGDPNVFNGELRNFVEVKTLQNDKEGRKIIAKYVHDAYPQWWKAIKRYHLRHDIQNMIGVRNWKVFEDKRNAFSEKKISWRNAVIQKAAPEDSKAGKFVQCLFGITNCTTSTDPANPKAREFTADGTTKDGDKTETTADGKPVVDADGNPKPVADGSGKGILSGVVDSTVADVVKKLVSQAGILSVLDSLSRIDKAIHDHSLSKMVIAARTAQAMGVFTTLGIAADQLTTGQVSSKDASDFQHQISNVTNNEGYAKVIDPDEGSASLVSAATTKYTEAKDKKAFCSSDHQAEMEKPENHDAANAEFQWNCPSFLLGGTNPAQQVEDSYNESVGAVLHPLLAAYHAATGGIFDVFNSVTGAITGPIFHAVLAASGQQDNVENGVAYATTKVMKVAGGSLPIDDNTPDGQMVNTAIEGVAAQAEGTMRLQGAAKTTVMTRALADKNVVAYQDKQAHGSFSERYLALSNPQSLLSKQLFAISTFQPDGIGRYAVSFFGNTFLSAFASLFSQPVHAEGEDGYAAANFAGIVNVFDMPAQCLNTSPLTMTPQNSTNADDLGLFQPDELNWDLMSNKEAWYDTLYAKTNGDESVAETVWDCALFDNTVRAGIGGRYGATGVDSYGSSASASTTPTTDAPSGNTQELAQKILDQATAGHIKLNVLNNADTADGSTPKANLTDTAAGRPAKTTSNCAGRGSQAPNSTAQLNSDLLSFILELSQAQDIQINALAGQCHGESTSNHYSGLAVDFGCPLDPTKADSIGSKYKISDGTGETCANSGHYHYSVGGH